MSRPIARLLLLLLGALLVATSAGCVRVRPWERELLAGRTMRTADDPAEERLDGHVTEYREGSFGGESVGGGGCGCN